MKKFFSLAIAFVAMMGMSLSAQTVESSRLFDNTYITLKGGASALTHPGCNDYQNFGHSIQGQASLEFGKWITPKFGVGVEGTVGFDNGSRPWGVENTVGWFQGRNWVNHVDVLALTKFNLNNIFHGYKGYADKVEFVPTVGIGWTHGWVYAPDWFDGGEVIDGVTQHENNIMTKYALDVNVNLNERWQINVEPFYAFNLTGGKFECNRDPKNYPHFDSRNSWWGLNVGVTYKIGKQFTLCPYKYTQDDVDRLNAEINDLRARKPETITEVKVVEKVVEKVVTKNVNEADQYVVFFDNASYVLTVEAQNVLDMIDKGSTVNIYGSASPDGPYDQNVQLANDRAEVVKEYLTNRGVNVADAKGIGTQLGGRVAVVVVK